eukprot:TRINITY_DN67253_c0_g1_i1.p1 TRINITY_DN67253_c0_g1~~TRINITY_DN67253_c0_g1_i1.p1  ORF type:complete len:4768 (-),score=648.87 TRINITY_DN67253_c0_g1_i1:2-12742(-)
MVGLMAKYGPLLRQPHVRQALMPFEIRLVEQVRTEVEILIEKFTSKYDQSEAAALCSVRHVPSVSGSVLWARQIERQLTSCLRRLQHASGMQWEQVNEMRRGDGLWQLTEELAQFMGSTVARIKQAPAFSHLQAVEKDKENDDLIASALALTYLELIFDDFQTEWCTMANEAKGLVEELEMKRGTQGFLIAARNFLQDCPGLPQHAEARNLRKVIQAFQRKISHSVQQLLDEWNATTMQLLKSWDVFHISDSEETNQPVRVAGQIFKVATPDLVEGLVLSVNFNLEIVGLINEVKTMQALGFLPRLEFKLVQAATAVQVIHPFAVTINQSLETVLRSRENLPTTLAPLLQAELLALYQCLFEGAKLHWYQTQRLAHFANRICSLATHFEKKVDEIVVYQQQINAFLDSLRTAPLTEDTLRSPVQSIQKVMDEMSLGNYTNLGLWLKDVHGTLDGIVVQKLEELILSWLHHFENPQLASAVAIEPVQVELFFTAKHDIALNPSIPRLRQIWQRNFHKCLAWILDLRCPVVTRFDSALPVGTVNKVVNYRAALSRLPPRIVTMAMEAIERQVTKLETFLQRWQSTQVLWRVSSDTLCDRVGRRLADWHALHGTVVSNAEALGSSVPVENLGVAQVGYHQVQANVKARYGELCKTVLHFYKQALDTEMRGFNDVILKEKLQIQNGNRDVRFVAMLPDLRKQLESWQDILLELQQGQNLLRSCEVKLPETWLSVDTVTKEWETFSALFEQKCSAVASSTDELCNEVRQEESKLEDLLAELMSEWEQTKAAGSRSVAKDIVDRVKAYRARAKDISDEWATVARAKATLDLGLSDTSRASALSEQLAVMQAAWEKVAHVNDELFALCKIPFQTVVAQKVAVDLDEMLEKLRDAPSIQNAAPVINATETITKYQAAIRLVGELRSETMKDRHWKILFQQLKLNWNLAAMTLGDILRYDLASTEQVFKEVIKQATGEFALDSFLQGTKKYWTEYQLELVDYQQRCKLIRKTDDLQTKVQEHLSSFSAMKMSPYYTEFEEEAKKWEEIMNKIAMNFDIWAEVQRRYVYLDAIFSSSGDIAIQLPAESQRYMTTASEFNLLMRKVANRPVLVDVLQIPQLHQTLDRLHDSFHSIQKSLGEYLEKQRAAFPRFYFVGDEDLLEMIGHSKDLHAISKHLKKMFHGLSAWTVVGDSPAQSVTEMHSPEGEVVEFSTVIEGARHPAIHELLSCVEEEMRRTLNKLMGTCLAALVALLPGESAVELDANRYLQWLDSFPDQIIQLATQVEGTQRIEALLTTHRNHPTDTSTALSQYLDHVQGLLSELASMVLRDVPPTQRKKLEHMIILLVYERDKLRRLISESVCGPHDFSWLYCMRFYWQDMPSSKQAPHTDLMIRIANAEFAFGWEYLGVADRLVQTPLTDRAYLVLTQALHSHLGGSPFGPAGTGKTETIKALGCQLGRFVLIFNCDEAFDFKAMGRIFVGLCQVGAWGCFDEFNRLEERILSAVSQQIQTIQEGLLGDTPKPGIIELIGREVPLNPNVGIFITMNPGYAGRSKLPDNLKQLFRSIAMVAPDRELIAQVMLYSQGFKCAEELAQKVVPFFQLCADQLSQQSHYDFGLRALKSVLVSAGSMNRNAIKRRAEKEKPTAGASGALAFQSVVKAAAGSRLKDAVASVTERLNQQDDAETPAAVQNRWTKGKLVLEETVLLLNSMSETITPKLVSDDLPLFRHLLKDIFPDAQPNPTALNKLRDAVEEVAVSRHLVPKTEWMEKILQLYQIQCIHHGLMLVGASGTGKTAAWVCLLQALERLEKVESNCYVIDPKAVTKEELYGNLDPTTREWMDGVFTSILRRIIDNRKGDQSKRHWIIFDGDVDPDWAENMNSVLDDNKLLTLPNGERLSVPPNVRMIFEVSDLKHATLATVSRCGMVWFSDEVLTLEMQLQHFSIMLQNVPIDQFHTFDTRLPTPGAEKFGGGTGTTERNLDHEVMRVQKASSKILHQFLLSEEALLPLCLHHAEETLRSCTIMEWDSNQVLTSILTLITKGIQNVLEYNRMRTSPMPQEHMERYLSKRVLLALLWGLAGGCNLQNREDFGAELLRLSRDSGIDLPPGNPIAFDVEIETGNWVQWKALVPNVEMDHSKVLSDVVIPTVDTMRHEAAILSWLSSHNPLLLCGPPGSGKTMTLTAVLRRLPDFEVVFLNFSSASHPDMIMKLLEQYCEYHRTTDGTVIRPITPGKWLVVFCDEVNLPQTDRYGTQRIITLMRQLIERRGFYSFEDKMGEVQWVRLERIMFAGACNPPTDPGRVPLSHRFLRWAPLLFVDFPSHDSLVQIYGTVTKAVLKPYSALASHWSPLTSAMVDFYQISQRTFTASKQPHYIYSPRELTRWTRAIHEALSTLEPDAAQNLKVDDVVRLMVHEGLRLFQDRLVQEDERKWTDDKINEVVLINFPNISKHCLERPMLYTTFLTKSYVSTQTEELRKYVQGRLVRFAENELQVQLVVFDSVLDHILHIDRIMKQPLGHMLLVGVAGGGKTVLSRLVAWMNGLSVFQLKAHRGYTLQDFEEDLRSVLLRAGTKGEKICFIFDESNIMDSGFLEYMNALLASGEVPGLFEQEDYQQLLLAIREGMAQQGIQAMRDEQSIYKWFVQQVQRNLHVVFTMNPESPDFYNRTATSPALFNRCTIDWFGEWSLDALKQVASEYTCHLELFAVQKGGPFQTAQAAHSAVVSSIVDMHKATVAMNNRMRRQQEGAGKGTFITPRHYLDFINQFRSTYCEKCAEVQDQQRHLLNGLQKLRETEIEVAELQQSLTKKEVDLQEAERAAQEKLQQMVQDQQQAEQRQVEASKLAEELAVKQKLIEERREIAAKALGDSLPALEEASQALTTIKSKDLQEIRSYTTPPPVVKKVMTALLTVMGEKRPDNWDTVRNFTRREDFIQSVRMFNPDKVTDQAKASIKKELETDKAFNVTQANKSSKACGPLLQWVIAQIKYADVNLSIQPLRMELSKLETEAAGGQKVLDALSAELATLEDRIRIFTDEYASLSAHSEALKIEAEVVKAKVLRSTTLLASLAHERERWEQQSVEFSTQMGTVVGDCLLSAGFMAYIGYYDEFVRMQVIIPKWCKILEENHVTFQRDLSLVEYLSTPDQRLRWAANKLPTDDLCTQNAIILQRFRRYPLCIDPSGQALMFIMNEYKSKNIGKTSFLEPGFAKSLESALRFGFPLLVQDVEAIDPILNPILNNEIRKADGRQLIRLGDKEIDLSPAFSIFLYTRDPTCRFAPDLCGRVTMVNFTVTPSSLQSQCLHQILQCERPDVNEKHAEQLKLQGEYKMRLRVLEERVLRAISDAQGNILENDSLIQSLEKLKTEASEVAAKMAKSEEVMSELTAVSATYNPLASACSRIYFMLDQMGDLHHLYRFSLPFFQQILALVLKRQTKESRIPEQRVSNLIGSLFSLVYKRVCRSLLQEDQLATAMRLCQLRLKVPDLAVAVPQEEWDFVIRSGQASLSLRTLPRLPTYITDLLDSQQQQKMLFDLLQLQPFQRMKEHMQSDLESWRKFRDVPSQTPHDEIPVQVFEDLTENKQDQITIAFRKIMIIKCFRPDGLGPVINDFVRTVFDPPGTQETDSFLFVPPLDIPNIVEGELDAYTPLLLCATPGMDPSTAVEQYAKGKLKSIAMGSAEGYDEADKSIAASVKSGMWVMLKNVHLSPDWLGGLEKRLHVMQLERKAHENFRLFMTSEVHPSLPTNLLSRSQVLTFQPPPGIRSNLLRNYIALDKTKAALADRYPVERARLHFLCAWLHAWVQERMTFAPLGWSKVYEVNESDLRCALSSIDAWVDLACGSKGKGRLPESIPPNEIPWKGVHVFLESIYGARVDNDFDFRLLQSYVRRLLLSEAYSRSYTLFTTAEGTVTLPEGQKRTDFVQWCYDLPQDESPEWLGLPINADDLFQARLGMATLQKFVRLQNLFEEESDASESSAESASSGQPQWAARLLVPLKDWREILAECVHLSLDSAMHSVTNPDADPVLWALRREVLTINKLVSLVRADVEELIQVCEGEVKSTYYHRALLQSLAKDIVPNTWASSKTERNGSLPVGQWISNLATRVQRLEALCQASPADYYSVPFYIGWFLFPDAFFTATRQAVARAFGWSLEALVLTVEFDVQLGKHGSSPGFNLAGLTLEGAEWRDGALRLLGVDALSSDMPVIRICWKHREKSSDLATQSSSPSCVQFPLYLNATRNLLLCKFHIPVDPLVPCHVWYERGTCLVAWRQND